MGYPVQSQSPREMISQLQPHGCSYATAVVVTRSPDTFMMDTELGIIHAATGLAGMKNANVTRSQRVVPRFL